MLAEMEWKDVEELAMDLEEVISYNDAPHQGLDGLSPNERRLMLCGIWLTMTKKRKEKRGKWEKNKIVIK